MKKYLLFWVFGAIICTSCQAPRLSEQLQVSHIDANLFQHHYITQDLPGETDWGYGCPALADFDKDGDLDYAFSGAEGLYWFENSGNPKWDMHKVGIMPIWQLGATSFDVDQDGWEDIIIGRYWYRNTQNPREEAFARYEYDARIETNIHDVVVADVDGDERGELIVTGEGEGVFWYKIPPDPNSDMEWDRTCITRMYSRGRIIFTPAFSRAEWMTWMVTETKTGFFLTDGWKIRTRAKHGTNIPCPLAKEDLTDSLHEAGLWIWTAMVTWISS